LQEYQVFLVLGRLDKVKSSKNAEQGEKCDNIRMGISR
jgi:hypothetical protein